MIDLDKLEALARAATPGPWHFLFVESDDSAYPSDGCHVYADNKKPLITDDDAPCESDSIYIAAANPAAVLELIALARQATGVGIAAIPLVSGEQLARTFPVAEESNYPEFDGFTPHSVQQHTPLAIHGQAGDIFDLIREWAHLPENKRGNVARRIIKHLNRTYAAGVRDTRTQLAVAGDAKFTPLALEQAAQACDQQADGTNGPYRTACLQCANAVRELRDAAINADDRQAVATDQGTHP